MGSSHDFPFPGKMLSVKRSNVRSVAAQQERSQRSQRAERAPRSRSEPRPLRRGDEVVVQGLTKAGFVGVGKLGSKNPLNIEKTRG